MNSPVVRAVTVKVGRKPVREVGPRHARCGIPGFRGMAEGHRGVSDKKPVLQQCLPKRCVCKYTRQLTRPI
jgi:hypothetical protein